MGFLAKRKNVLFFAIYFLASDLSFHWNITIIFSSHYDSLKVNACLASHELLKVHQHDQTTRKI